MPLMDEFREEREALKHGTFKEKMQYFMDYYKWYVIGGILAVICVVSLLRNILSARDPAINIAMLNSTDLGPYAEQFSQDFAEYAGIDLNEYTVIFDTNYYIDLKTNDQTTVNSLQKLMVYMSAGEVDMIMGGGDAFSYYVYTGIFRDLRDILDKEQIEKCEPCFYYADRAVLDEIREYRDQMLDPNEIEIPDPRKPEEMEDPIPIALYVDMDKVGEAFYFSDEADGIALGALSNTRHAEYVLDLIDYVTASPLTAD